MLTKCSFLTQLFLTTDLDDPWTAGKLSALLTKDTLAILAEKYVGLEAHAKIRGELFKE
tara:strand:- start:532 stop:708 length:177 start_codon:yes stop_codon:yes gene_type:complete